MTYRTHELCSSVTKVRAFGAGVLVVFLFSGCGESKSSEPPQNGGGGGNSDAVSVAGAKDSTGTGGVKNGTGTGGVKNGTGTGGVKNSTGTGGVKNSTSSGAAGVNNSTSAGGTSGAAGNVTTHDVVSAGAGNVVQEMGFKIRAPKVHKMDCSYNSANPVLGDVPETDWLCTFKHAGVSGHLYVQSTPVACNFKRAVLTGQYESRGWIELDGTVSELSNVVYAWGEVHHVDSLSFELNGRKYTYGHSTMMYGRPCQLVDCISVSNLDGTMVENGCTEERTLPVTCVSIAADGTHRDLVDRYVTCDQASLCSSTGGTVKKTRHQCGNFSNTCERPIEACELEPDGNEYDYCHCPEGSCFEPLSSQAFQWKGCVAIDGK